MSVPSADRPQGRVLIEARGGTSVVSMDNPYPSGDNYAAYLNGGSYVVSFLTTATILSISLFLIALITQR